ncbi:MAG: hypothetical protein JWQ56_2072 [Pseudarthrobacter sp.]|nr:hypothetical protein [Pseudarthrobacter sp.]
MADTPEPLIPAPRHLRKRRFRSEIPDTHFLSRQKAADFARRQNNRAQEQDIVPDSKERSRRRKRAVALALFVFALLSIVAIVLALIFVS